MNMIFQIIITIKKQTYLTYKNPWMRWISLIQMIKITSLIKILIKRTNVYTKTTYNKLNLTKIILISMIAQPQFE